MDEIQRKLALIDKQLGGGLANTCKQIISTAPLVFTAIGLIVGILVQNTFFGSRATGYGSLLLSFWLVLLALCTVSAVLFFFLHLAGKPYALMFLSVCALVSFVCLGAVRLISFQQAGPDDIRQIVGGERQLATIRGVVITEPYTNRNVQWEFARFAYSDPGSSFYLKLGQIRAVDGWAKMSGIVRVQVDEPVLDFKMGDYIELYCWLDTFKQPTNPGQFNTAEYLARKNIFAAASVKSRDGIEVVRPNRKGTFTKLRRRLRDAASGALLGELSRESANRGLLEALLLGCRANIDSDTYIAFRKTGLLHFISLSGLHFGILIGIVWWLCARAGLMKHWRAAVCITVTVVFSLIVPSRAPTLRAAIICIVFCLSFFFRRRSNSVNTLSLAAIILLLIRPTQLFEAGWQLSFASVLGIIFFTDPIHFFLYEKISNCPWRKEASKAKPFFRIIAKALSYILRLFSVGLAAWLAGAPILLYHFYTINPLASLWTVVCFPFVGLILTVGFLKMIMSLLLPSLAAVAAVILTGLSDLLIWVVRCIAHLDVSEILVGRVSAVPVFAYYCFFLFAGAVSRRPVIKKTICISAVLVIVGFLGLTKWQRTHRDNLVLTCLDVGHGQAIVAQLAGKANLVFDAGSLHKSDVGSRIVVPFLNYSGMDKIDSIFISHNDIDHINGIPEIVKHCRVNAVYANDSFFERTGRRGSAGFLDESLCEKGLTIQRLGQEIKSCGSTQMKFLWPDEKSSCDDSLSDNDKSAVALIEFATRKILLCSDIEKFAQGQLLKSAPNLKADIVVVPHHGSMRTLDTDFLENIEPEILICSCGKEQNEAGQITLRTKDAKSFYTSENGAITVRIAKDGVIETDCVNE